MERSDEKQLYDAEGGRSVMTINTLDSTKAIECLNEVIKMNGWNATNIEGEGDLIYVGHLNYSKHFDILSTKKNVIYSRIPEFRYIARKCMLGHYMNVMAKFYRDDFSFVPKTYLLPRDEEDCKREMRRHTGRNWILKPSAGDQGSGIHIVNEFNEISDLMQEEEYVLQTYIDRPLLIDKKKFDLRIYMVLYGVETMHGYLYEDGMARFCTVNYEVPTKENKKNDFMHLTNFSLNKKNENFVKNDRKEDTQATKRKLSEIYRALETESPNGTEIVAKIRSEIINICKKTLSTVHANAAHLMECAIKVQSSLFHIVGVDIMLDENYNAWLLEINAAPAVSICVDNPLNKDIREASDIDREIKLPMVSDAFQLADIYRQDNLALENIHDHHSLIKIYSNSLSKPDQELNLYHNLKIIYDSLAGEKGVPALSPTNFGALFHKVEFLRQGLLQESDLDVIYSNSVGREESLLSFTCFPSALYQLFVKFKGPIYESGSEEILESMFPGFVARIVSEL